MSTVTLPVIKTDADHAAALERINALWGAPADTPEGDELDALMVVVDAYEEKHHPIDPPDPVEAIFFRMEQEGMDRKELEKIIGSKSRVSEVLNRTRRLSMSMIRNLHKTLHIPAEILIQDYKLRDEDNDAASG